MLNSSTVKVDGVDVVQELALFAGRAEQRADRARTRGETAIMVAGSS